MAIRRIRPVQDTFVSLEDSRNVGLDEILELGPDSRILMQFLSEELRMVAAEARGRDFKAVLHLSAANAKSLPILYDLEILPIAVEWVEGRGQAGDIGISEGVVFEDLFRGPFDPIDDVLPEDDSVIHTDRHRHKKKSVWKEGTYYSVGIDTAYTRYQINKDIEVDISMLVKCWIHDQIPNNGIIIKLHDEDQVQDPDAKLYFYSSETHTIHWPYLDIIWDDSVQEESDKEEVEGQYRIIPKNLRKEYSVGERCRIDLDARPLYPKRVFSTHSLYEGRYCCPDTVLWGVQDSYTGERIVDFDPVGTRVSRDKDGSFFILDTDLISEPERSYNLIFEDEREGLRYLLRDTRNVFRVVRNGEIG